VVETATASLRIVRLIHRGAQGRIKKFCLKESSMNSNKSDEDTDDLQVAPVPPEGLWPGTGSSRAVVDLAAVSDRGLVRVSNQDQYLVLRFGRSMERLLTNLLTDQVPARADEVGYGFVVADGMGGPAGGEVASQMVIKTLVRLALQEPDWVFFRAAARRTWQLSSADAARLSTEPIVSLSTMSVRPSVQSRS
jgi:hypothetical protein